MKTDKEMKKTRHWKTGLATFLALALCAGCGGDAHDHAAHDHDHDHAGHDHDHAEVGDGAGGGDAGNASEVAAKTTGAKPYALETCIVSGEKLGSMGKPVVRVHEGQEVKFCCDSCVPDFEKEPKKFLAKLEK